MMSNNNNLVTRRGGHTFGGGLVTNVSQADIESLKKQIEALAEQIRDLEEQAREAGMIKDESEDEPVPNAADGYVLLVHPDGDVPGILGHLNGRHTAGAHLSINSDGQGDSGGDEYVQFVYPLN
jgi:hypothetical protein